MVSESQLEFTVDDGTVSIRQDDLLLARYNADTKASKPGFDVVALPAQAGETSGENLVVSAPHDHPWHLGLFFCQKLIDGLNCWESEGLKRGGRPYGYAVNESIDVEETDDGDGVAITQEATWKTGNDEELLGDERTITVFDPASTDGSASERPERDETAGYLLTWTQRLTAIDETRRLSSETIHGHYSGLSVRFARSLTDGRVLLPDETDPGTTTLPRDASGPRGRWCDYSGPLDGRHGGGGPWTAGITTFNHPENHNAGGDEPTNWFLMTEPFGFLAANPTWRTVHTLEPGRSRTWRWGLWVHAGTPDEEQVDGRYRRYLDGALEKDPSSSLDSSQ